MRWQFQSEQPKPTPPSRYAVLSWVRECAPDLRILNQAHCVHEDPKTGERTRFEHRRCSAAFTFAGAPYVVHACEGHAPDPDDEVVRLAADAIRRAMKEPPAPGRDRGRPAGIEQAIVLAAVNGSDAEVAALERELMTGKPRSSWSDGPMKIKKPEQWT